ncbi:MAG: hypothetical protein Q7T56_15345 [Nocardioidaceae bacterium]|nr:hypothetical protein [Nocardioidaceae bacterium]
MNSDATYSSLPWAVLLSAVIAFFAWRSWRAGDRWTALARAGWALVPWALWLVGLMRVLVRVGAAVGDWAGGFVFRPSSYIGLAVGAVAVLLVLLGSWRRPARADGAPRRGLRRERSDAPASAPAASRRAKAGKPAVADEDMDDIEAILRKHGIN